MLLASTGSATARAIRPSRSMRIGGIGAVLSGGCFSSAALPLALPVSLTALAAFLRSASSSILPSSLSGAASASSDFGASGDGVSLASAIA